MPEILVDKKVSNFDKRLQVRNILKNLVFRRIIEIREIKKQPKLSDLLGMFKDIKNNPKEREALIKKLIFLYDTKEGFAEK